MSVATNEQISIFDDDDTSGYIYDADQPESPDEFSSVSFVATKQRAADNETRPENHSDMFSIPVFEQDESENSIQTHKVHETDLVTKLELPIRMSSNITLQKAISKASLSKKNTIKDTDLSYVLLQYILKHNLRWRDSKLPELQLREGNTTAEQSDSKNMQLLTIGNIMKTKSISDSAKQSNLHPLDIFVKTFSHCSHELKVVICQKLLMCKQAIPLIYHMPGRDKPCFTSLPLYSLVMEYRTIEKNADVIDAASAKTKVIGFLRIGKLSQSKSRLLNGVINDDTHAPFCHRDSLSSPTKALSLKGLIEAIWFLPSGKTTDLFKEVITFLNLRGDAENYSTELSALSLMCSTIVAMVDVSNLTDEKTIAVLDKIGKSTTVLVLGLVAISDETSFEKLTTALKSLPEKFQQLTLLVNFDKNGRLWSTAELRSKLRENIASLSKDGTEKCLLTCGRDMSEKGLVILDENMSNDCTKGHKMANSVFTKLCDRESTEWGAGQVDAMPFASMRDAHLPLQGTVWINLSDLTKKYYKAGNSYGYKDSIKCDVERARQQQLCLCKQLKPAFESFVQCLLSSCKVDELCQSFITWLKIRLDANTRRRLPDLFKKLRSDGMEVRQAGNQKHNDGTIQAFPKTVGSTVFEHYDASFGLEHFIRELGQLYECVMVFKHECGDKTLCGINKLPQIVAKLLLKGEALEILDGDTANVPLQWIQSVFMCLRNDLGNDKLFIVSVLGLQSSGKSTLLNTMFGLQFKVSAGRCTKGVYAHLVCLENRTDIPYKYMLVLDTEGLRGQTREKDKRDNELATFVIGMGDLTIVNVKGENTAEVKDVLQIAVHAFLRMCLTNRILKTKRKCIFIHQNVGDVHAMEKRTESLKAFLKELDDMTQNAAIEENIGDVTCFNQVVDFQLQKHVLYFPDLWSGDPPMAHCNSGYSESVCEALEILHETAIEMGSFISVTDLVRRIEDLWKGIMTEDFVFCFQNSLEIKIYNRMDTQYHKYAGSFGQEMMKWLEEASFDLEECKTTNALRQCRNKLQQELIKVVQKNKTETTKKLTEYFDNTDMRETLKQWKDNRILKFGDMATELYTNLQKQIDQKMEEKRIEMFQMENQRNIIGKAKELAASMKGKQPTDEEIEEKFDLEWLCWTFDLLKRFPLDNVPTAETVVRCLFERLAPTKDKMHLDKYLEETSGTSNIYTPLNATDLQSSWRIEDVDMSDLQGKISLNPPKNENWRIQAKNKTSTLFRELDIHFKNLLGKGIQFHKQHAVQVIDKVLDYLSNEDETLQFTFLPLYKVKVAVHVCRFSISQFEQMNITYQRKYSARTNIERYKKTAKSFFINTVKENIAEVVAADLFCDCLKSTTIKYIKACLPQMITHEIFTLFDNRKRRLLQTLMKDLAKKCQYDLYSAYLNDPFTFAYSWIKSYVNESLFKNSQDEGTSKYMQGIIGRLIPMIGRIKDGVEKATEHVTADSDKNIKDWVVFFQEYTRPYLKCSSETYSQVSEQKVVDFMNFQKNIQETLSGLQNDIIKELDETELIPFCCEEGVDYENIFQTLWGCEEQCPFCLEPCYRSKGHLKEDIKHSCIQHRPIGVCGTAGGVSGNRLVIESCSFLVQSREAKFKCSACSHKCKISGICNYDVENLHSFKDYKLYFPDWEMSPCTTMDTSIYWMWFMANFETKVAKDHGTPVPQFPFRWLLITADEAVKSLQDT